MKLSFSESGGAKREKILPSEGTHVARCVQVIDFGTIKNGFKDDDGEPQVKRTVRFVFELCNEKAVFKEENGEQPLLVVRDYTFSMSTKSTFFKVVKALNNGKDPDGIELSDILSAACMVEIEIKTSKSGNPYPYINTVSALMKGLKAPDAANETIFLLLDEFNQEVFDTLPDFMKEIIMGSKEGKELGIEVTNE